MGILYMFKDDVYNGNEPILKALKAWDLQIIDCVLDDNGKRSGAKYAVLIINGAKTYFLKFQSGPEAVVFYSQLKQCWTDTRGKYYVDFSTNSPEISGEANGPQPIQKGDMSESLSLKKKSSIYMPNPVNGGTLNSPKEQDAVILNLINEYEKKKQLKKNKRHTTTHALNLAPNFDDLSSTETYDESGKFEITDDEEDEESDDPLYRQVSQMTSKEKIELAQKQSIQIEIKSDENDENIECVTPIQTETKRIPPPPARKNINNESNDNQQQKKEEELPNYDEIIVNEQQNNESELDNNVSNDNNETVENELSQTQNDKQNEMEMNDETITNNNEIVTRLYEQANAIQNEVPSMDHISAENEQDVIPQNIESNDYDETVKNESIQNDKQSEIQQINDENMANHNEYPTNEIVINQNEDHIFAETQQNEQHIEVEPVSDHNLQSIVKEDKMNENDQTNEYSSNHRIEIEQESNEQITEKHQDNAMIIIPPSIPPINNEEIIQNEAEKIKALTPKTS